jgi:ribosomal protein S18 acetylase RimI-like enzyme
MTSEELNTIAFRKLEKETDEIPYHLLLLADPSKKMIDEYLSTSQIFLAYYENNLIGTYVLYPINKGTVEIKNIAIQENHQRKGIGKLLLSNAINVARASAYKTICIGTANSSVGELYLYQKMGFEITEIKKDFFTKNYPDIIIENGIQAKHMIMMAIQL